MAYTDCTDCRKAVQVSEFIYRFLCEGNEMEVYCEECDLALVA